MGVKGLSVEANGKTVLKISFLNGSTCASRSLHNHVSSLINREAKKNPEKVNFVVYHNVSILNVAILSLSL